MDIDEARVRKLLDTFAIAILDERFLAAAELCEFPCPIIRPTGTVILEDQAACARDIADAWVQHRAAGVRVMRPRVLDIRSFTTGMLMVDVEWHMVRNDGQISAVIHTTYGMQRMRDSFAVTYIIAHNEVLARPIGKSAATCSPGAPTDVCGETILPEIKTA